MGVVPASADLEVETERADAERSRKTPVVGANMGNFEYRLVLAQVRRPIRIPAGSIELNPVLIELKPTYAADTLGP